MDLPAPPSCDVIGCFGPAEWVRRDQSAATDLEFLCDRCWATLHAAHPDEAAHYARFDFDAIAIVQRSEIASTDDRQNETANGKQGNDTGR
jgi:hypothetical protein